MEAARRVGLEGRPRHDVPVDDRIGGVERVARDRHAHVDAPRRPRVGRKRRGHQLGRRDAAQVVGGRRAERAGDEHTRSFGRGEVLQPIAQGAGRPDRAELRAAHADRAMEQPAGERRGEQQIHRRGAGRQPGEGDVAGVAPECRDVALHPLERGDLVSEPVVAARPGRGLGAQRGVGEEPQAPESVVEGDDDEPRRRELRPVVQRDRRAAELERAEVQPDEHGQAVRRTRGRPDVEVEAVLALALVAARVQRVRGRARTGARSGRSRSPRARPSTAPGAAAGGSAAAPPAAPRRGCRGTREPRRRAPASR